MLELVSFFFYLSWYTWQLTQREKVAVELDGESYRDDPLCFAWEFVAGGEGRCI